MLVVTGAGAGRLASYSLFQVLGPGRIQQKKLEPGSRTANKPTKQKGHNYLPVYLDFCFGADALLVSRARTCAYEGTL